MVFSLTCAAASQAGSILFVGNSFTFGAMSPVRGYGANLVTDLNNEGVGGVPALFKTFANQAGLDWSVSLETSPGKDLSYHLANKAPEIGRTWDVVLLQGHSMLDPSRPGAPERHVEAAGDLARLVRKANANASVYLISTWSRADQVYKAGGRWYGRPISSMAADLADANLKAVSAHPQLTGSIPVGGAWNRAMSEGLADDNPYDGLEFGKVDLWTYDQYHASAAGYYLEALVIFGAVTGVDPLTLPDREKAAMDLGIDPRVALGLRKIASEELKAAPTPRSPQVGAQH